MDYDNTFFSDEEIRRVLNKSNKTIDEFIDNDRKEIGDRVKVIDYSSMSYIDNQFEHDDYDNIDTDAYYVVCEIRQKNVLNTKISSYKQDLIIANPLTKILFKIGSKHVKLL